MNVPFHFVPGVELDPKTRTLEVFIKGSRPQQSYDFDLVSLYPTIPSLAPELAYRKIKHEIDEMDRLLSTRHGLRAPVGLPDAIPMASTDLILALLDPGETKLSWLVAAACGQPEQAGKLIVPPDVRPFPLRLASPEKLLHTLTWTDANLKLAVEHIALPLQLDGVSICRIVEAALKLYCYFVKQDEYRLASSIGFNQSMFIQDRIIQLIFGDDIYWSADHLDSAPRWSNRIACDVLRQLGVVDPLRLAGLAVAMGVIWTSRKDLQTTYLRRPDTLLDDLATKLDDLSQNWGIDDRLQLLKDVADHPGGHVLLILDDNGELVFDLALFQEFLRLDHRLRISIAVNRFPVSNNIALPFLAEILADDLFRFMREQQNERRVVLIEERQLLHAFDPASCTQALRLALAEADIVYIKGANFFEVFQAPARVRYYGFVVFGRMSSQLSGCQKGQNVLARVPGDRPGYIYRDENDLVSLRDLHTCGFRNLS